MNDYNDYEGPEDACCDAHEAWITENFGTRAAATANYGWVVDEVERVVCTKVYGHGIVSSSLSDPADIHFEGY